MNYILFLTLIISTMMTCLLLIYSFLYSQQRGVRYFAWAMVCRVIFGCSVIMELHSDELSMKLFFRQIEQTALVMNIPLIILCVLDLYGRDKWLKWQRQFVLFLPFMGWTVLIWTNNKTHAVFESAILVDGYLEVSRTNLAFGFISICYCILLACVYFIMTYFRKARPEIRKPGIMVIVLASIPAIVELIKLAYPNLSEWLLPLSVYCGLFGLIILLVVYRNKLFAIIPMARDFIVDTVREGMLTVDQKGMIIDCNPFIQPLFEKTGMPIIGRNISELLKEWPVWQGACRQKQEAAIEIKTEINGEEKYFMTKVYPLYSKRDRVLGTVSILFDITEKQQRLEEIAHLNFMKDQLFTLVSHDIREPIATQVSLIEMLEEEKRTFTPENAELIDLLSTQIRSTYMTVNNVLEWFRGQKNDVLLHPESVVLSDLVEEACRILWIKSKEKHINIDIKLNEAIYVYADREAIIMVLRNLLSNAIKFSDRGATVEVTAEKCQQEEILITVRDQGRGMTEERVGQLFNQEPLTTTIGTEGEKGTGLGLQVSRQFVKMSGGDLMVESKVGEGSAFHFSLKEGEKVESYDY